jgi:hypothetical protein
MSAKAHSSLSDSADSDDEVEIIEQWDQRLKSTQQYKIVVVLLNLEEAGLPSQEKMMDYLLAFAGLTMEHCFPSEGYLNNWMSSSWYKLRSNWMSPRLWRTGRRNGQSLSVPKRLPCLSFSTTSSEQCKSVTPAATASRR